MYQLFVIYFISVQIFIANLETITVKLIIGDLIGNKEATVFKNKPYYAFYGVPYAEAPVKKLRFKDPIGTKAWKKKYDGSIEYHGACAQSHIIYKTGLYGVEDCLYLNIYTPTSPKYNTNNLKAVIVWFHGYAFTSSFSHLYGPDFFIDNDIVFVSVIYRIGVFGFLKTDDGLANGNMGLKDINMSLKWIKKNINKFGGDPNRITVMGFDSAGTLLSLLLMQSSKSPFSKMILHSSSLYSPSIFQNNPFTETKRLKRNLMKMYSKYLNTSSTREIITASLNIYSASEMRNFQRPLVQFTPSLPLSGSLNTATNFGDLMKNKFVNVPILIGLNTQESVSEIIPFLNNAYLLNSFQNVFKFMVPFMEGCFYNYTSKVYGIVAEKIKNYYFGSKISEKSIRDFIKYTSDLHKYPIYHFIKELVNINNKNIFVYKFNYRGQFNSVMKTSTQGLNFKVNGSAKGDELCYLLRCEPLREMYVATYKNKANKDKILITELTHMWANFAKTGNPTPNDKCNYTWPPFTKENYNIRLIEKVQRMVIPHSEEAMYKFWNYIYNTYFHKKYCNLQFHDEL